MGRVGLVGGDSRCGSGTGAETERPAKLRATSEFFFEEEDPGLDEERIRIEPKGDVARRINSAMLLLLVLFVELRFFSEGRRISFFGFG